MHRKPEPRRNLLAIRSRRERDVGVIVRLNAGKSAECFGRSATDDWAPLGRSFTEVYKVALDRKGTERIISHENQIDYLYLRKTEDQVVNYIYVINICSLMLC